MYTKKGTMLYMIIVTLLIMSFAVKGFAQTFTVSITPPTISIAPGQEVTANVTIANAPSPGIYSYQLKVTYNTTLLNATNAEIPSDQMLKPVIKPTNVFIVAAGDIDPTLGQVSFAVTLLGEELGKTGGGTLASVTFAGLANGISTLGITELILVDGDGNQIPEASYTVVPGSVTVIPEFSTALLIAVFAIMSAAAVALKKKLR